VIVFIYYEWFTFKVLCRTGIIDELAFWCFLYIFVFQLYLFFFYLYSLIFFLFLSQFVFYFIFLEYWVNLDHSSHFWSYCLQNFIDLFFKIVRTTKKNDFVLGPHHYLCSSCLYIHTSLCSSFLYLCSSFITIITSLQKST